MLNRDEERFTPRCSRWDRSKVREPKKKQPQVNRMVMASYFCVFAVMLIAARPVGNPAPEAAITDVSAPPLIWSELQMADEDVHRGELILVNNEISYIFPETEELVYIHEKKSDSYSVQDYGQKLKPQTLEALNQMCDDFRLSFKDAGVNIISSYRTYEFQEQLMRQYTQQMGAQEAARWCAKPGGSEHHTGLALDLGALSGGVPLGFDGQGDYAWIGRNCDIYGFIVHYTADKTETTGFYDEPWHLRYVGIPHASLMKKNGFCLEEYIDWLKNYPWEGEHLRCGGESGMYEIYYVAANPSGSTKVPVPPDGEYRVSGNNVDGFIVTIRRTES